MKALKILGGIVGFLALAVGIFWLGWVRHPSPGQVCGHLGSLSKKAFGDKPLCEKMLKKGEHEGLFFYAKKMKCLNKSKSLEEVSACVKETKENK